MTSSDLQDQDRTHLQRFGVHLKLLRVKAGLSQEELAGRAGLHRPFVGLLERGQSGVSIERLPDLADREPTPADSALVRGAERVVNLADGGGREPTALVTPAPRITAVVWSVDPVLDRATAGVASVPTAPQLRVQRLSVSGSTRRAGRRPSAGGTCRSNRWT